MLNVLCAWVSAKKGIKNQNESHSHKCKSSFCWSCVRVFLCEMCWCVYGDGLCVLENLLLLHAHKLRERNSVEWTNNAKQTGAWCVCVWQMANDNNNKTALATRNKKHLWTKNGKQRAATAASRMWSKVRKSTRKWETTDHECIPSLSLSLELSPCLPACRR